MPSIAIVGGSRGIGFGFARKLSANSDNELYVVVRNKARSGQLASLAQSAKNIHIFEADVVDAAGMKTAAAEISMVTGGSLDMLIHNAARTEQTHAYRSLVNYPSDEQLDEEFITAFKVNVLGVIHSVNAFLPLMRKGTLKKIIVIGTSGGERDVVWNLRENNMAAYGTTKASAHMVVTKYAVELESEGFIAAAFCPGLVDTHEVDDSKARALTEEAIGKFPAGVVPISVDEAVQTLLDKISKVGPADTGKFFLSDAGIRMSSA